MDRIREAVEQARKTRAHMPETGQRKNRPGIVLSPSLSNLRYTKTRTVSLDPKHLELNRVVALNKLDPVSASFDLLRTQVTRTMSEHGWRSLAIVAPTPGVGKTVIAVNLAISIAQQPEMTSLLVDFDLRRPRVGAVLGIPMPYSVNNLIKDDVGLPDVLINPGIPRFVVLPTARPEPQSAELLGSNWAQGLLGDLRNRYDDRVIIVDLPPILFVDDALAVLPYIDCVLVVVSNGETSKSDLQETLRLLGTANIVGTVLNKSDHPKRAYY